MAQKEEIFINGQRLLPIFTRSQLLGRSVVHGNDDRGPYIAYLLRHRNPSLFYGWYILVSPEDKKLVEDYAWLARRVKDRKGNVSIMVGRNEWIDGKQFFPFLNREIWERMHGSRPPPNVFRLGHPFDFRRIHLSDLPPLHRTKK